MNKPVLIHLIKLPLIILTLFAISLSLLLIGASHILLNSFLDLEQNNMTTNVERAHLAFTNELEQISTINGDYSGWDEAYKFIQNGNHNFIKSNLPDTIFPQLHINFLMYVTNEGKFLYSRGYDLERGEPAPIPESLLFHITNKSPLVNHRSDSSIVSGVLPLPEGLLMITSRPVLTNEYKGPIHGALIIGRFLNLKELAALAHNTSLDLSIYRYNDKQVPTDFRMAVNNLSDKSPVLVNIIDKELI
ncbi:MAG: CHASE4 domain-containing protein, partial [Nitrospira sp.]|nr:CHASE4 domain-containing protein [Nitrospira sp.]